MKTEIHITKQDCQAIQAGNTSHLRTVPGTERVIADPDLGRPVLHRQHNHTGATANYKHCENLMHVNLAKCSSDRRK